MFSKGSPAAWAIGEQVSIEAVLGVAVVVALPFALLWSLGMLTRHLKSRRLGPTPYGWQARRSAGPAAPAPSNAGGAWQPFWADLKSTATKPYSDKTTLEKAYGACVLLFTAAVFPMPYEYYFSLRLAVCIALYFFVVTAYRRRAEHAGWLAAIVVLMVLYNPIMPLQLGVQVAWTAINVATIYALYRAKLALDQPIAEHPKTAA